MWALKTGLKWSFYEGLPLSLTDVKNTWNTFVYLIFAVNYLWALFLFCFRVCVLFNPFEATHVFYFPKCKNSRRNGRAILVSVSSNILFPWIISISSFFCTFCSENVAFLWWYNRARFNVPFYHIPPSSNWKHACHWNILRYSQSYTVNSILHRIV